MKKPRDLGNDKFMVRTAGDLLLGAAVFAPVKLHTEQGRKAIRRMANRLLEMCDYWEAKSRAAARGAGATHAST